MYSNPSRRRAALGSLALGLALLSPLPASADVGEDPPQITITSPADGDSFDGPSAEVTVAVDVVTQFSPLEALALQVDGEEITSQDDAGPYGGFTVTLGAGMHELVAVGTQDGIDFPSAPVNVVVFDGAEDDTGGCSVGSADNWAGGAGLGLALFLIAGLGELSRRKREERGS